MYVCILDQDGEKAVHRKIPTEPDPLLRLLEPYREDLVLCVECLFCWYWMTVFWMWVYNPARSRTKNSLRRITSRAARIPLG